LQFVPHWAIEGVEKSASDPPAVGPGCGETEQRAVGKSHDFLDIPSVAADRDDIAGGEWVLRHEGAMARRVPRSSIVDRPWSIGEDENRTMDDGRWTMDDLAVQDGHRRAEVRIRGVEKFDHEGMRVEHVLHQAALDPDAAAVNQAHLAQARGMRRADILVDHRLDVRGPEGVEVEATFDRDLRSAP
jgi:hypothetical protein